LATVTTLTSRTSLLAKQFTDSASQKLSMGYLFDASSVEIESLNDLARYLNYLENEPLKAVIRGRLIDGVNPEQVRRTWKNPPINFEPQDCQWLCIDIDDLSLPERFEPAQDHLAQIAQYTASQLPDNFNGVDFYYHFSSSMCFKPGIRIHLWYWLDKPISDQETKAWLSQSSASVDSSLFNPIQLHFTANPIVEPPEMNPLQVRSGMYKFGENLAEVVVPDGLRELSKSLETMNRSRIRNVGHDGQIDDHRIVRNEHGEVTNGREWFLFRKSVDAAKELTKGNNSPEKYDDLEALTDLTWDMFSSETDTSDGRWTIYDAHEKAQARLHQMQDGWQPNGRFKTTTLIPTTEPYFDYLAQDVPSGIASIEEKLNEFFEHALTETSTHKKLALRITMGSGKTTKTVELLKQALKENPNLNVEIYVPRHELIDEILPQFAGIVDGVEVVPVRGRSQKDENGNAVCLRYDYVQALEKAGLSVRTNACRRNDNEKCEHLDNCAYWKQFSKSISSTGSIRIFPHGYMSQNRDEKLPTPDITIIDESFVQAGHSDESIPDSSLRALLNNHIDNGLGDLIVNTLRDDLPFLQTLRENNITAKMLDPSNLDVAEQQIQFNGTGNNAPRRQLSSNKDLRTAKQILQVIREELENKDRQNISRLRYNGKDAKVHIDVFDIKHIAENSHLLILDATADEIILGKLFGDIEFERIDIQQKAHVTQVYNRTGSNISWGNKDEVEEEKVDDLVLMLKEHSSIGEKTLCISNLNLANHLRSQNFPDNLKFEHFGNIRGLDSYKDFDTIFITGRNQPPQAVVDGMARAIFWDADEPLYHDPAASFEVKTGVLLPNESRGYFLTDPDQQWGVNVKSFTDGRIEAIHQQMQEAETIQAIARLRLVHSKKIKYVYLLGNLPIEMPIDSLVKWNELAPNRAEKEFISKGNIPLTPRGWMRMRPDMVSTINGQPQSVATETSGCFSGMPMQILVPYKLSWSVGDDLIHKLTCHTTFLRYPS
jgi:hypothetical protein